MELFRDKYLYTKAYFEKPATPSEAPSTPDMLAQPPAEPRGNTGEECSEAPAGDGRVLGHEALAGKIVGLFFSAGWCPPCQQFIPLLCDLYDELQNRMSNFEVVFISFDLTADDMEKYYRSRHRDWYALTPDDPLKDELKRKYNITAVPRLIIVTKNGEVVSAKGRKEVQDRGVVCFRNWQATANVLDAKADAQAAENQPDGKDGDVVVNSGINNGIVKGVV